MATIPEKILKQNLDIGLLFYWIENVVNASYHHFVFQLEVEHCCQQDNRGKNMFSSKKCDLSSKFVPIKKSHFFLQKNAPRYLSIQLYQKRYGNAIKFMLMFFSLKLPCVFGLKIENQWQNRAVRQLKNFLEVRDCFNNRGVSLGM